MAPSGAPQKRTDVRAVDGSPRPVDRPGGVELDQQLLMQRVPDAGLLPVPEPSPARHAGPVAVLLGQVLPRDPGVQDVQDAVEDLAVGQRLATGVAMAPYASRDQ